MRFFTIILTTAVILPMLLATGAVAQADQAPTGDVIEEEPEANTTNVLYQFSGGGALRNVEYRDGSTYVTVAATEGRQEFAVAEGDLEQTGSFEYETVTVPADQERTVELPVPKSSVVVTTSSDGYYYRGSVGPAVITGQTTEEYLQIAAISGIGGSILALLIVAGQLKRRHKNSYKELFSEERKQIDKGAYEGLRDKVLARVSNATDNKISTLAGIGVLTYTVATTFGFAPPPGDIWLSLSDGQRLTTAGTGLATVVAITPMYFIADRLYNPDKDYLLDLDSQDVYRAESGDKSGTVAAYSGPPEKVSDMEVDGGVTTISTPGGRAHLVRGFDPEENTAAGNPPELADDREASIEVQKIDHNREILTDLATVGRDLIGAMTAFRVTADSSAMKDIDAGLRNTVSAGNDSMQDVLEEAVAGTKYEGTYQPEDTVVESEEAENQEETNEADEVTNDSKMNPKSNGGSTDE